VTKSVRNYTLFVALVLVCIGGAMGLKFAPAAFRLRDTVMRRREQAAIIRRPSPGALRDPRLAPAKSDRHGGLVNLAPLATVTASSIVSSSNAEPMGAGVADGTVDASEWVTSAEAQGAWIELRWDRPVSVAEVELHDRRSLLENILGGTLLFDDGSMIPVPALPPDGTPWSIHFPPKTVQWIRFRIDSAQGKNEGLAEIMVYGKQNP
jgi:hypothetical protein